MAIVPDGCVDLMWIEGEMIVAGPDVGVAVEPIAPASTIVGIRFRPGAAVKWLGLPMSELVGARLELSEFWGIRARQIAARIGDRESTGARMRTLEEVLVEAAPNIETPGPDMGFVFNALRTGSGGAGMSIILDRLGVSPRTLRRRCTDAFGYGPKTLDRILRFQRFLRLARNSGRAALAGLAFEAGYSDQAYLTREVRRLSGFSPAEMLARLRV